jgi:CRP/FNR family transcriptional regulator, anaerobic regulatory protein
MSKAISFSRLELPERPRYAAAIAEELLTGSRKLRSAFIYTPLRFAVRDAPLVRLDDPEPSVILIRSGFAFRFCGLADGRRAILHIVIPGDFVGLDHLVLARPIEEITAACRVGFNAVPAAKMRELLKDPSINLSALALLAETRWRSDRLAMSIGRLDAQARICVMLLDMYQRLRRQGLISRMTFNLPLTQEQMADHLGLTLVHVNRTLRRLREERIVLVDRQVVIIMDLERMRDVAQGLPQPPEMPEPYAEERVPETDPGATASGLMSGSC